MADYTARNTACHVDAYDIIAYNHTIECDDDVQFAARADNLLSMVVENEGGRLLDMTIILPRFNDGFATCVCNMGDETEMLVSTLAWQGTAANMLSGIMLHLNDLLIHVNERDETRITDTYHDNDGNLVATSQPMAMLTKNSTKH